MRLLHEKEAWVTMSEIVHNFDFYLTFFYSNLFRKENVAPICIYYRFDDRCTSQARMSKTVNTVHKDTLDLHYNLGV
jgi:hypothetical protein